MLLLYILIALLFVILMYKTRPMSDCFFSCTCYLAKNGKYEELVTALESIQKYADISFKHFVIINEHDIKNTENQINLIKKRFPEIKFINKSESDKGQARSLNIILDMLKESKCKYWIHWEEGWYLTGTNRKLFKDACQVMESNPHLSQLQLTNDWRNLEKSRLSIKKDYIEVLPFRPISYFPWNSYRHLKKYRKQWPLYSLRPSINRTADFVAIGKFDESPLKWPFEFECDYGFRFLANGCRKGILKKFNNDVKRNPKHISTYK